MINQAKMPAVQVLKAEIPSSNEGKAFRSMKTRNIINNTLSYIVLVIISIIWVLPIVAVIYTSLRSEPGLMATLAPLNTLTFSHYTEVLTMTINGQDHAFIHWFLNTLLVAVCTMLISTIFVLAVAYTMSRLRFKARKGLMNANLILGMFPGFMSMIAVYNILKAVGIDGTLASLIIIYSAGAGSGFYIAKGFFDTISKSLDEAARIDGANNAKVFFKIIVPLSKPIVVYTMLTSFMGPWVDYIFSSVILRSKSENYTIALGLYTLISSREGKEMYFTDFFAGSVLISIPIMVLFLFTQKYYVSGITGGSVKG
jgi:arabinogalactan oligomer / maltooligosaccharide transport system permease protein